VNDKEDKIRAGLWGLIVADAMGVPHEFKRTHQIPSKLQMVMPKDYHKTYKDVPYGTWSDDTSLALALADSLAVCRDVDLDDYASRMLRWYESGDYTPDGVRFDIGNTTRKAFHKLAKGVSPKESGEKGDESQANGSLMRTLPLALWHTGHDKELYLDACEVSAITHAHPIVQAACGVYCIAARYVLIGDDPKKSFRTAMERMNVSFQLPPIRGTGYVLDSLAYAVRALESMPNYELTVIEAIRLGNDTDTTACIAGGIVAVRDGLRSIPRDWMDGLQGRQKAEEIIERFITYRAPLT
jgi:ADP-ribosylglycohydrolase